MNEEIKPQSVKLEIDLATMMGSYDPKKYLHNVVVEALKSNPKIIGEVIQTYILTDLLKSEEYQTVKEAVRQSMANFSAESLDKTSTYRSALNTATLEAVNEAKPRINQVVSQSINTENFKKNVSKQIAQVVENRVMNALGEVCEGCERDYY